MFHVSWEIYGKPVFFSAFSHVDCQSPLLAVWSPFHIISPYPGDWCILLQSPNWFGAEFPISWQPIPRHNTHLKKKNAPQVPNQVSPIIHFQVWKNSLSTIFLVRFGMGSAFGSPWPHLLVRACAGWGLSRGRFHDLGLNGFWFQGLKGFKFPADGGTCEFPPGKKNLSMMMMARDMRSTGKV